MEANQNIAEWPCGQPHRWGVYAYWTPRKCDPDGVVHIISVYNVVPHSSTKSHAKKKKFYQFFCHYYKVKAADEQGPTFFGETKTAQTMAEEPRSKNHGLWYSRTGT